MCCSNYLAPKALVWLAAALLPVQAAFPANCGCERPSQRDRGHTTATPPTHCGHSGCCRGVGVSECFANLGTGAPRCAWCRPKMAASECACVCGFCRCASHESPTPAPTRSDNAPSAKEVLCHGTLAAASLLVVGPQIDNAFAPRNLAASPATSLQRLSTLCRFLI